MIKMIIITFLVLFIKLQFAQDKVNGLRGDPEAIADAEAMVEVMGGMQIWSEIKSLHFVHKWYPCNRIDTYIENEILDLTATRSWVDRKSEINHFIRSYSPEGKYWTINNGNFEYADDELFKSAMERASFNFYHLVRAVATGDPFYEIRFGKSDIPTTQSLEFYDPAGVLRGWIILNAKKEPIVKATPEYRYTLGPLKQFGNLWVPAWGIYDTGFTRYEMISLLGDNKPPDSTLFIPPFQDEN